MTSLRKIKFLAAGILAVMPLLWASCGGNDTYHHYEDVTSAGWSKNDTLKYRIDTASFVPGTAYDIQVETVNNSRFQYQNLWLFVRNDLAGQKAFRQDTIQLQITNPYGKWSGKGFGSFFQVSAVYKTKMVFTQKRNYEFQIIQGMRDEPLAGIERVGLRVSRSE